MDADPLPLHRLSCAGHALAAPLASSRWAPVLWPALIVVLGAMLRLSLVGQDLRLHPDEALFAAQARLISEQGDGLLRSTDLDKPPLTFYSTALAFRLLTPSEFAARLPNAFASLLTLAALVALSRSLYADRAVTALGALLLALAPFDLAFAATVFTDVQATLWALLSLALATRDRWGLAGIAAALMIAAKSTALLVLPLILALGLARQACAAWLFRDIARRLGRFALPCLTGILGLVLWDAARAPRSFWALGWARNNPGRLIRSDELLPRLEAWARWLAWSTGSSLLLMVLGALIVAWLAWQIAHPTRAAAADWLSAGYLLAALGWYTLMAFNTYDRYLHTLIPLLLLLAARALIGLGRAVRLPPPAHAALIGLIVAAILPGTAAALRHDTSIGGDHGQHSGIEQLAAYLNAALPGAIVYDHWLGWELAYYLGEQPAVQMRYVPLPEALSAEYSASTQPAYLAAPSPERAALWIALLQRTEIPVTIAYYDAAHGFIVYRLGGR